MSRFTRFAAIDWSGAKGSKHKGIAVALCDAGTAAPTLVTPPPGIWSRSAIAEWIIAQARSPILIGMDFSFSAPWVARQAYLPGSGAPDTAKPFWGWINAQCDDEDLGAASLIEHHQRAHFYLGAADGTKADFLHWRACETTYNAGGGGKASTVYDAIGAAQVAKASFAGMRMLNRVADHVPVWPFDMRAGDGAQLVEIYTTIAARATGVPKGRSKLRDGAALDIALTVLGCARHVGLSDYNEHATDAILTAAWLRANAGCEALWQPPGLTPLVAQSEGWTFGVR
jgi:hypothetical protein